MTDAPPVDGQELAALVAAKLCHDFISPSGAIVSGLDLLKDPSAQDMRDDALALIDSSAQKLVGLVNVARVAFGAATSAERFSSGEIEALVQSAFDGIRAELDWQVPDRSFSKPQARALLNLALLSGGALPGGGVARIEVRDGTGRIVLDANAEGPRARLKGEVETGLKGERLTDGLAGQWVQPYWLWLTATEAGGGVTTELGEGSVRITVEMPA